MRSQTRRSARFSCLLGLLLALCAPSWSADTYYWNDGQRIPLQPTVGMVAARLTPAAASRVGLMAPQLAGNYDRAKVSYGRPWSTVWLSTLAPTPVATATLAREVAADNQALAVLPMYGPPEAPSTDFGQVMVQFGRPPSGTELAALAAKYRFHVVTDWTDWLPGAYVVAVNDLTSQTGVALANALYEQEGARYSEPDFIFNVAKAAMPRRAPRSRVFAPPADPLYPYQWFLKNTGSFPGGEAAGVAGADVDAEGAWQITKGDPAVKIAVVDDSCDVSHEDFAPMATKIAAMRDVLDGDGDPSPVYADDNHGTACAGIATANSNSIGVSGIAPDCRLIPIRFLDSDPNPYTNRTSNSIIVAAFLFAERNGAAVISNSWGPVHNPGQYVPISSLVSRAIDRATAVGRGGKGCVFLFAASNYAELGNTTDESGLASYPKVICVGSTNFSDTKSIFSQTGQSLDITAPGGDASLFDPDPLGWQNGLVTTDRMGAMGYTTTNYTMNINFSGTSAATPLAAGIAALALSVNPDLTYTEVQQVLQMSAVKVDPVGGAYDSAGHSLLYGYGRVSAKAAVELVTQGTPVTITVNTVNGTGHGGTSLSDTAPVQINYTQIGWQRVAQVWDGQPVTVKADPGTQVVVEPTDSGPGTAQRWILTPGQANTVEVTDTAASLTLEYINQLHLSLNTTVPADAVPLSATNSALVTYTDAGAAKTAEVAETPVPVWSDAGTTVVYAAQSSGTTGDQRWLLKNGAPLTVTPTLATRDVTTVYYNQVMPSVSLSGTTRTNAVSVTSHMLFGAPASSTAAVAYSTWSDWADVGSTLSFSEKSLGAPVLSAQSVRSFKVVAGLRATIQYEILAVAGESGLTANTTAAPADGQTDVIITVTIRDSAGHPLAGVAAERLTLTGDLTDGLIITSPTTATDTNGQAVFKAHRSIDGPVEFRAAIDGERIAGSVRVRFMRVMTVSLTVPGLYLASFPLTTANSTEQIAAFPVTPKPSRVARWNPANKAYSVFSPTDPRPIFDIQAGRGYFVRTAAPATLSLYGDWNTTAEGSAFSFTFETPVAGWHMVGNPRPDQSMPFRLQDFQVSRNGALVGTLRNKATWDLADPYIWAFNGTRYELVLDSIMPGAANGRSQLQVYEGAWWRVAANDVSIKYAPGAVARAAEPISPSNFGIGLTASVDGEQARVVLGSQEAALRAVPPPLPEGVEPGLNIAAVGLDGSRAAADYLAGAVVKDTTWKVAVTGSRGREVTIAWPALLRQLPDGYRARLTDPTSGRTVALNTTAAYRLNSDRELLVTVSPRGAGSLAVLGFAPVPTRGGAYSFDVQLSAPAELVVVVSSLSGREVARTAPTAGNGLTRVTWDGLDAQHRPLPAGIYQVTVVAHSDQGDTVRAVRTISLR